MFVCVCASAWANAGVALTMCTESKHTSNIDFSQYLPMWRTRRPHFPQSVLLLKILAIRWQPSSVNGGNCKKKNRNRKSSIIVLHLYANANRTIHYCECRTVNEWAVCVIVMNGVIEIPMYFHQTRCVGANAVEYLSILKADDRRHEHRILSRSHKKTIVLITFADCVDRNAIAIDRKWTSKWPCEHATKWKWMNREEQLFYWINGRGLARTAAILHYFYEHEHTHEKMNTLTHTHTWTRPEKIENEAFNMPLSGREKEDVPNLVRFVDEK